MPMAATPQRPWRWALGGGGGAGADADLGTEGHGAVDRLLAGPGRPVPGIDLGDRRSALDALLWLGLRGDPLIGSSCVRPATVERPPWLVGLSSLPGSMLIVSSDGRGPRGRAPRGRRGAARVRPAWRRGAPPAPRARPSSASAVEPHLGRDLGGLPAPRPDGAADVQRGAHRWTFRYARPDERRRDDGRRGRRRAAPGTVTIRARTPAPPATAGGPGRALSCPPRGQRLAGPLHHRPRRPRPPPSPSRCARSAGAASSAGCARTCARRARRSAPRCRRPCSRATSTRRRGSAWRRR